MANSRPRLKHLEVGFLLWDHWWWRLCLLSSYSLNLLWFFFPSCFCFLCRKLAEMLYRGDVDVVDRITLIGCFGDEQDDYCGSYSKQISYTSEDCCWKDFLRDASEDCIKLEHPRDSKVLGHNSGEQWAHDIEGSQREQECADTSTSFVHEIQVCYKAESHSFILQVISNNSLLSQ